MSSRARELLAIPLRAARRASLAWGLSLAALVVMTIAFWPAFQDQTELTDLLDTIPEPLIEAFGMADFTSPAGYLRGNLYAVFVPLFLAVAGVLLMNGQTASDEDAGRMEQFLAQPVSRQGVFAGRVAAVAVWVILIGLLMLVAQVVSNAIFGLEIAADRLLATVVLCLLIGLLHAGLAAFVAGLTGRPGLVLAVGLLVAVFGYVAAALFPLSDLLEAWKAVSPWDWALGHDPLVNATEWWRYLALAVPALVLAGLGTWAFARRDVQAA